MNSIKLFLDSHNLIAKVVFNNSAVISCCTACCCSIIVNGAISPC